MGDAPDTITPSDPLRECMFPFSTISGSVDLEILFPRGQMLPQGPQEVLLNLKATTAFKLK